MKNFKRFLIEVENIKQRELGIENVKDSFAYIDVNEICAFYDNQTDEGVEKITLMFKSGDTITVVASFDNIVSMVNENQYANS